MIITSLSLRVCLKGICLLSSITFCATGRNHLLSQTTSLIKIAQIQSNCSHSSFISEVCCLPFWSNEQLLHLVCFFPSISAGVMQDFVSLYQLHLVSRTALDVQEDLASGKDTSNVTEHSQQLKGKSSTLSICVPLATRRQIFWTCEEREVSFLPLTENWRAV